MEKRGGILGCTGASDLRDSSSGIGYEFIHHYTRSPHDSTRR